MLDVLVTIRQRTETSKPFDSPMLNPVSGETIVDAAGEPIPYIPKSVKSDCPIKISNAYNDDDDLKALRSEAMLDWEKAQAIQAGHAKKVAKLEVKKRKETLCTKFFKLTTTIAVGMVVTKRERNGGLATDQKLSLNELAALSVYDALKDSTRNLITALAQESNETLLNFYKTSQSYDDGAIQEKMSEADSEFLKDISNQLHGWMPELSFKIWNLDLERARERNVAAELRKALAPKATAAATQDVEQAIVAMGAAVKEGIRNVARKETERVATKVVRELNRSMRKNSSGGGKIQTPRPTNNGQRSGNASRTSARRQNQRSSNDSKSDDDQEPQERTSQRNGGKSKKKKKKKDNRSTPASTGRNRTRNSNSNQNSNSNSRPNGNRSQGGGKGGGKRGGAGRR